MALERARLAVKPELTYRVWKGGPRGAYKKRTPEELAERRANRWHRRDALLKLQQMRAQWGRTDEVDLANEPLRGASAKPLYDPLMDDLILDMRLAGLSLEQMATILRTDSSTIEEWLKIYPSFKAAWDVGGGGADALVARRLFQRATGYEQKSEKIFFNKDTGIVRAETVERFPPDTAAMQFWLTNRQPDAWKRMTGNGDGLEMALNAAGGMMPVQIVFNSTPGPDKEKEAPNLV